MPMDVLTAKLEETDPRLVSDVRGYDEFYDVEDAAHNYTRAEIIDWTPDAPYLESDLPRRNPDMSRGALNLRYNGTRGSHPELPRHPELFLGFMGNDPRGALLDPRMDQVRGQIDSRAANLVARMTDSEAYQIEGERPWTNQALSYAMKDVQRQVQRNTKVFSQAFEGRPWSNNHAMDAFAAGDVRAQAMAAAHEGFEGGGRAGDGARFADGDHRAARDEAGAAPQGFDGNRQRAAAAAPWHARQPDAPWRQSAAAQARGAGQARVGEAAVGGGQARTVAPDQALARSRAGGRTNRHTLAATMAAAAAAAAAPRQGRPDQPLARAHQGARALGARLAPRDVAAAYRQVVEETARRAPGTVQDGAGGVAASRALAPAARPGEALWEGHATHATPGHRQADMEAVMRGHGAPRADAVPLGLTATSMPLARADAAGLEVAAYGAAAAPRQEHRAQRGHEGFDAYTWTPSAESQTHARYGAFPEWRSATQSQGGVLSDAPEYTWGLAAPGAAAGPGAVAGVGPKSLRSGGWSDGGGLTDGPAEFGEDAVALTA